MVAAHHLERLCQLAAGASAPAHMCQQPGAACAPEAAMQGPGDAPAADGTSWASPLVPCVATLSAALVLAACAALLWYAARVLGRYTAAASGGAGQEREADEEQGGGDGDMGAPPGRACAARIKSAWGACGMRACTCEHVRACARVLPCRLLRTPRRPPPHLVHALPRPARRLGRA